MPEYQRGYSWETRHRQDLLEDIERVYESDGDYKHFTGTVVAAFDQEEERYEIVDGQQRLTSLYMLSKAITDKINHQELSSITSEFNQKLKPNRATRDFFAQVVFDDTHDEANTKSKLNILNAWEEFNEWAEENEGSLEDYANIILNHLGFLLFVPKADKETGIMFEVINNRGKPLSQLEKVKNYLTYYSQIVESQIIENRIVRNWSSILKNLSKAGVNSNDEENTFLRYCWICFHSKNKQESYHVYENLKKRFSVSSHNESKEEEMKSFIDFLLSSSKHYVTFFSENNPLSPIKQLRHHPQHASIMPLYLSISEAYKRFQINKTTKRDLLDLLEKASFRIYVCPNVTKRSDTHQGKFFGDARKLFEVISNNEPSSVEEKLTALKKRLQDRIKKECSTKMFVQSLTLDKDEDYDYMNWNGLNYFLANYEVNLAKTAGNKTVTLEDVFPKPNMQGNRPDDKFSKEHLWGRKNRAKYNNRERDEHEKQRLGNFVLLEKGLNSKGNKASLKKKLRVYYDLDRPAALKMVRELKGFYDQAFTSVNGDSRNHTKNYYLDLYKKINDLREEKLVDFALQRWGLESEKSARVVINSFKEGLNPKDETAVYRIEK